MDTGPHGHPYLHEPLLYISNVPAYVSDESLATAFVACGPFRPRIARDTPGAVVAGTIEFRFLDKAEKALATLHARPVPQSQPPVPLVLSPYPPTSPPTPLPPPSALPRLVKHLPPAFDDARLYDLFRPFGALASARTHTHLGPDTATVEFWNEDDARAAEDAMHCADVDGHNIAVHVYQSRRTSADFNPSAPPFVPAAHHSPRTGPYPALPPPFVHGPGQQVQLAPLHGPGSSSHSGLIDPCNLFCKNLDPAIDSNDLFSHFRKVSPVHLVSPPSDPVQFGQIVSARVMRNEAGDSRGFGFVSFQTPSQASNAMHAMNGAQLGTKQIVVRLHEPKQLRQEKLAQRFGHNGHPRSASGATSPAASEAGDSYVGFSSPRRLSAPLSPDRSERDRDRERSRRGSGSYFNASPVSFLSHMLTDTVQAALSGTLNLPMRYDDLAGLSPVVRREVLTGELSRRVKNLQALAVPETDVAPVVDALVSLALSEVVQCIDDPSKLENQVKGVLGALHPGAAAAAVADAESPPSPSPSPSPAASHDNDNDSNAAAATATASAPEHPSTPVSVSPPRTASPGPGPGLSGLGLASSGTMSERERMWGAVWRLESGGGAGGARASKHGDNKHTRRQEELVELLMSLPRRERAMCLFNTEVLRGKLRDAVEVLESAEEEEGEGEEGEGGGGRDGDTRSTQSAPAPVTPQTKTKKTTAPAAGTATDSPKTPDLSSRGPSAASSPLPGTPGAGAGGGAVAGAHTLASLARLPASEILRVLGAGTGVTLGLGLQKPDVEVVRATDEFVDGLVGMQVQMQKQLLGDKLYKTIKSFGIKSAPKVTIALLDQEDLRALAQLMNCYPVLLKEKALGVGVVVGAGGGGGGGAGGK